jgi:transcription-repair coupling factor (superfamily II helicase)
MLQNAVEKLKRDNVLERTAPTAKSAPERSLSESLIIDLPTPAYIPTDWIPEIALRLQLYRRMAALETTDAVQVMREELADRFGALPPAVLGLLYQIDVKILGTAAGATHVQHRDSLVRVRLPYLANVDRDGLARALGTDVTVSRTAVEFPLYVEDLGSWQSKLLAILRKLSEGVMEGMVGL